MTALDRESLHRGYWPSRWPVECGGNRRQKSATGRLDAAEGSAQVVTSTNDRWNVMVIEREPGEWFLGGTMAAFSGPAPFGWVQRVPSWLRVSDLSALGEPAHLPIDCGEGGRALECLTLEHELDRSRVHVGHRGAGDGL